MLASTCFGPSPLAVRCCSSATPKSPSAAGSKSIRPSRMIEWSSPDEGWIRFDTHGDTAQESESESEPELESEGAGERPGLDDTIADLLAQVSGTHYQFLGITPEANAEEIKAAYRKLSKQYHPDSTTLPLDAAEKSFLRLKEAYTVLSSDADRKLYDWHLAQEASRARGGRFIWPYEVDRSQRREGSKPPKWRSERQPKRHPVEVLDGKNLKLTDQQQTALAFDLFAVLVSLATMLYVGVFKHS